ncbi:hydantoinase/oxoprolinase family protein [Planctobacterium marinum]|uniref:hydantoinase/oxoprolinase family protein n=1 Tax=Planctobacterium marinum TaxID=1631968 RepID=UPI001E33F114|nr:hydantoinase/oxoprolinase family protein [Planctobacterium marinum]MCC2607158.1 hydantoinase/oxoprolinase family protein [Planctobacterium marinum]
MRIGIDVGGTHTDAVLMQGEQLLAATKALTSQDVLSGIIQALRQVIQDAAISATQIQSVMIGTTQFTNAVVERRELAPTAIIRMSSPSGEGLPPGCDWPTDLVGAMQLKTYQVNGGYLYDGWPLSPLNQEEIHKVIADIRVSGIKNIAVASAFSPMNPEPEFQVEKLLKTQIPDANITLSHKMGKLGILERENAAALNVALLPFAHKVVSAMLQAIHNEGLNCPMFISQNDGTLMNAQFITQYPALTFSSGPTNSLRGASKLTGLKDAIVVDIGGTTSDIGILQDGFPRESNIVISVGGVRTNFRMPDIQAVGLGGGSIVQDDGLRIGPQSTGHNLVKEALIFGGSTLTATDIIVASGKADIGNARFLQHLSQNTIKNARNTMHALLDQHIDMMKPSSKPVPVILVGGGAILVQDDLPSASQIIRPENAAVANAIGASIAQVGGEAEAMLNYRQMSREAAIAQVESQAINNAVAAGANADSLKLADIEETNIPYMDDGNIKVRVKVIGDIVFASDKGA